MADIIFSDAICRGYSIHSPMAIALWEMLLNCLLECFREELGSIEIINAVPQMINADFLSEFYGDRFCRIENRIPAFEDDGKRLFITTDELPYLFSSLEKADRVFSTYTVVRPRSFAVKPYLREEFIRYFQFVISTDIYLLDEVVEKIKNAALRFFGQIRLPVVLVDRHSDSYYSQKSCFHSAWLNGNIESVLQCGVLKKRFDNGRGESKVVIDVGGAQRLLASFIYANSDTHGLFLPYSMRDYDVIISSVENTDILDIFISRSRDVGCRIKLLNDKSPLKKIRNSAITESALAIVVQRKVDNKDFLTIYNRDMTKMDMFFETDINEWLNQKYIDLEKSTCDKQFSLIHSRIRGDRLYYKNGSSSYALVKEGLFN